MKPFLRQLPSLSAMCLVLTLSSCFEDAPAPKNEVFIEASTLITRSASELQTFMSASPLDIDPNTLKYDVKLYKVSYKTTFKGEEITASGLVVLPETQDPVGIISFQHGTIVAKDEAPTRMALNNPSFILYSVLGSAGFIGVISDYIGFGESGDKFHPYYVEESTATAIIDNIRAAREFARSESVNFNKKLFLAGYSQGGYATMAVHKAIEANGLAGFDLIASFPAAGGYDVKGMQEYFFQQETYDQPYYLAYVALSYDTYYGWDNVLDQFFRDPYADRIPSLFNGTNSAGTINSQLTTTITDLVQPELAANIDTDAQYSYLVDAFESNSLLDWAPTTRMYMYHGTSDVTVPYQNSVATYERFMANGASPQMVTLTPLEGEDHGSGVYPYLEAITPIIQELQ